jgi:adenylate kinase family enzyme
MRRVVVVGNSGSGKTRVASAIAEILGLPLLELDSVMHREGWDSGRGPKFQEEVADFAKGDRWVIDGNYTSHGTREVVWPRADTVVWLDISEWRIVPRVVLRTLRRVVTRERLWDGPREPWTNLYSLDPYQNIVVWAWTRHRHVREKYQRDLDEGTWEHTIVHRLRSPAGVRRFLASLGDTEGM